MYGTVEQLKIRIQVSSTPTADQITMMEEILEAASRSIDNICRRPEGFQAATPAEARYFAAGGEAFLRIPSCTEITAVAAKTSKTDTTYTAWVTPTTPMAGDGDWIPCTGDSAKPSFNKVPYTLIILDPNGEYTYFPDGGHAPVIMVTARWGLTAAVPADIREACLMQAAIWFKRFQGSMSSELGTLDLGEVKYRRGLSSGVKQILIEGGWVLPLYGGA